MISSCAVRDKQSKKKSFLLAFKTILLYMCTASVHSLLLAYFMVKLPFPSFNRSSQNFPCTVNEE